MIIEGDCKCFCCCFKNEIHKYSTCFICNYTVHVVSAAPSYFLYEIIIKLLYQHLSLSSNFLELLKIKMLNNHVLCKKYSISLY